MENYCFHKFGLTIYTHYTSICGALFRSIVTIETYDHMAAVLKQLNNATE